MMKKIILVVIMVMLSVASLGKTNWHGEDGRLRIMYKILDPLIVTVEQPVRIKTNTLNKEFTYSSKNGGKAIHVTVKAPYNRDKIDEYLRKIYERVYFQLKNGGDFILKNENPQKLVTIKGQGYFIDNAAGIKAESMVSSYDKSFNSNVAGDAFVATTDIDAKFTLPEGEVPMGVYRGTLTLDVWFGGTIGG